MLLSFQFWQLIGPFVFSQSPHCGPALKSHQQMVLIINLQHSTPDTDPPRPRKDSFGDRFVKLEALHNTQICILSWAPLKKKKDFPVIKDLTKVNKRVRFEQRWKRDQQSETLTCLSSSRTCRVSSILFLLTCLMATRFPCEQHQKPIQLILLHFLSLFIKVFLTWRQSKKSETKERWAFLCRCEGKIYAILMPTWWMWGTKTASALWLSNLLGFSFTVWGTISVCCRKQSSISFREVVTQTRAVVEFVSLSVCPRWSCSVPQGLAWFLHEDSTDSGRLC